VGIRLSPYESYLDRSDSNPLETNTYMLQKVGPGTAEEGGWGGCPRDAASLAV